MRKKTEKKLKPVQNKCTVGPVSEGSKKRKNELPQRITWSDVVEAGLEWFEEHLKVGSEKHEI